MPRRPKVQRTFKCSIARVLCIALESEKTFEKDIIYPGVLTEAQIARRADAELSNEKTKFVAIRSTRYNECTFSMDLLDFMHHAMMHEINKENLKEKEIKK